MRAIWKYELYWGQNSLILPVGATLLHFAIQNDRPTLWALVDPEHKEHEERRVVVVGTGQAIIGLSSLRHLGTAISSGGIVLHALSEEA